MGDRFLGPTAFTDEPWQSLASQFGNVFPQQLNAVAIGQWAGPVRSAFGVHLVLVTSRTEGGLLPLDKAREEVKRDLLADRRRQANQAILDALLTKYQVKIDWPTVDSAGDAQIKSVSLTQ